VYLTDVDIIPKPGSAQALQEFYNTEEAKSCVKYVIVSLDWFRQFSFVLDAVAVVSCCVLCVSIWNFC